MASYKETVLGILDCLTCTHCKEIRNLPVTLDCGHSVCLACARKIGSENKEGQRCCCPKCGVESVTEYLWCRVNRRLWEAAAVVHVVTAFLRKGGNTPEVRSAGDSESGIGDLKSESSLGTSCSISSMQPPPFMASTRELFIRMFLPADGLESEDGLSQWSSGSSVCSDREQWSEDETSARGSLSGSGGLCDPELPQQSAPASPRAHILDLLKRMFSDGTGGSVYKTSPYKQVFLHILDPFTCPHCKEILRLPVTLDCGHSVCLSCAEKIGSKNDEGQQYCCCPKCGAKSVTENVHLKVNGTLSESVNAVREHAVFLWYVLRTLEACSDGVSEDGMGDSVLDCSVGSSWSIRTMDPPLEMLPKRELFNRMFLVPEGLESEDELSECTENEQRYKNQASARRAFSHFVRYLSRSQRDPELSKKKSITLPFRSPIRTHRSKSLSEIRQPITVKFLELHS